MNLFGVGCVRSDSYAREPHCSIRSVCPDAVMLLLAPLGRKKPRGDDTRPMERRKKVEKLGEMVKD